MGRLAAANRLLTLIVFAGGVGFLQEEGHAGGRIWPEYAETLPVDVRALCDERGEGWVRQCLPGWGEVQVQKTDGKLCSSYVGAWQSSMKIHDSMAENRIRFAQKLNEMSDELSNLVKEVEKTRKQVETTESYSTWIHD